MDTEEFLKYMESGKTVIANSEIHKYMVKLSNEAMKITFELNSSYHTPEEIRKLFSMLTGKPVNEGFGMFPPFYTDCGKNITVGKDVFINSCCCFQDQGGIKIGDGALIGHNVVLATLNHGFIPEERKNTIPKPIIIGKNVWIGSNSTVLGGVTIGDNAIIGAGSLVNKDVPQNIIAAGVPAKIIKSIYDKEG
ncbi:MAG: DapH/DapD/GlmU-related protein [Clostridia bacterium]|nr:DapH/DapD/GlmU-related protein [Clostridia bacterium]